jgi:spermidine synthase
MNVPHWKRWLSYLFELPLEQSGSPYNPVLEVSIKRGQFRLSTANAIYSYGDRMDWSKLPGQEVLLLGLGLGSIPYMLEKTYQKELYYTAVDIDEEVMRLADKYLLHTLKSPIEQVCADAAVFVAVSPDETYDLICVDLFDDDRIPEEFAQPAFLEELSRILRPNGLILYNCLAFTPDERRESERFFNEVFRAVFPQAKALYVGDNLVLAGDQRFF